MSASSSNCFFLICAMVIGFIIICHCHRCDGLSGHLASCVWRIGSQWVNAGYLCCGLCYYLTCLYWLPVDWCYRVHHVQLRIFYSIIIYLNTLFSLAAHWLPLLRIISKQRSDINWIQPTMIWSDTVIHHTSERIFVTRNLFALYALFVIHLLTYAWNHVCMRPYDLMTVYIYVFSELESLFSISALVATHTKKCTYIYNRKS